MKEELFALEKASVSCENRPVLTEINMHIYKRSILGIICDNIIEYEAFTAFFSGNCAITSGRMRFLRKSLHPKKMKPLFLSYFCIINNRSNLIASLSIAENICIFFTKDNFLHSNRYITIVKDLLKYFRLKLDITKRVSSLTTFEWIVVELLKAYAENKKIIVLVNLSDSLLAPELAEIHRLINQMRQDGRTFIVMDFIGANMFQWTDEVLVIKNGTSIASFHPSLLENPQFYNYMLSGNHEQSDPHPAHPPLAYEKELPLEDYDPFVVFHKVSTATLKQLSFSLEKGELLKIICLDNRSFDSFKDLILGRSSVISGKITFNNEPVRFRSLEHNLKKGIHWCPESPYKNMLFPNMTVRDNLMLELSHKSKNIWLKPGVSDNIDQFISEHIGLEYAGKKIYLVPPSIRQKIAYSKLYLYAPKLVVCERPFSEVDLHLREATISMLSQLQTRGISIIILTITPSDQNLVDGETIYLKNGQMVSEEDMYQYLYRRL